jgi:replicative DNA helicase
MTNEKIDVTQFLHSPARALSIAMTEFERRKNALHRLGWGVDNVDNYLIPMQDGDLVSLLGRPGHSKTTAMIHLAKQASNAIHALQDQGTGFNRIVVYATWETLVEEFIGLLSAQASGQTLEDIARGRADLEKIRDVAVANISNRIYVIGRSRLQPSYVPITLEIVDYILRDLREQGKEPMLVLLDYLQRIPSSYPSLQAKKNMTVEDNVGRAKNLGLNHFCPTVMGVQASRDTDDGKGLKFPSMNMAQWSSSIEQDTDKLLAITRPILYMEEGTEIEASESLTIPVTPTLLCMKVLKQRWGKAGKIFYLFFDPATITLGTLELGIKSLGF